MARPIRVEYEGAVYHVTARGNERRAVFRDDADRYRLLNTLAECTERFGLVVHAYCLMSNHYHLIVETPRANLSAALGWLQTTYTIRFNRRHDRSGHLFQGRYKAIVVEADAYARELVRYVHANPVRPANKRAPVPTERHGKLAAYPWSSHRAYAGLVSAAPWLSLDWLAYWGRRRGEAQRAYRRSMAEMFGRPAASPFDAVRGGLALGSERLWTKASQHLEAHAGQEEIRWRRRVGKTAARGLIQRLAEKEPDCRVRIWLRVRLGGERPVDLARTLGYADGSGVLRVVQRLDALAQRDAAMRSRLAELRQGGGVSIVDSAEELRWPRRAESPPRGGFPAALRGTPGRRLRRSAGRRALTLHLQRIPVH